MDRKKVLIVTYYWPPAGGPGVQRWLKFVKYLPEFGYEPVVFIPENPSYPIVDETLIAEVPSRTEIIKQRIWEPYQWAEKLNKRNKKFRAGQFDVGQNQSWKSRLSIWVRGNFFIPDARVFWVKPSVKFLRKYLAENQIETIITTGPPHSLHLIGLGLKKEFPRLKWLADFRDPWTEISYYKHLKLTPWADAKHRKLEQAVFQTADITLATSYTDAENFRNKGANAVCITNGFDDSDLKISSETTSEKFQLGYIGVLEQLRNPENLWRVLAHLISENTAFGQDFLLKFVGRVDDKILQHLEQLGLGQNILSLGYLSHNEAVAEMQKSDVLLITNFPTEQSKGIIPGKIFEYLATKNRILSFGVPSSDVEKILKETGAGRHFSYQDFEDLKAFILEEYTNWKQKNSQKPTPNITQYHRRNLAKQLVDLLGSV